MINQKILITALLQRHKPSLNTADYNLCYENQHLNAAVFLSEGDIHLYKNRRLIETYTTMSLIGAEEFLAKKQYPYRIEIKKGSKIILLTNYEFESLGLITKI